MRMIQYTSGLTYCSMMIVIGRNIIKGRITNHIGLFWNDFLYIRTVSSTSASQLKLDILTPRSIPGLKSPKKLWWAKEITPELHVAGGLTERQLKYAFDGGFKSVISLFNEKNPGTFGGEPLVSSSEGKKIAELAGFQYETILKENSDWVSSWAVSKLSSTLSEMEKPTLVYANPFESVAFLTLLHLAHLSTADPKHIPNVNSKKFYKMSVIMGLDFTSEKFRKVVSEITEEDIEDNPPNPDAFPHNWSHYWLAHPVYKNWFTAGQIRRGHLKEIEKAGFKSVINMRQGMTMGTRPSQEPITLINVLDNTDTYDKDFKPLRQTDATLKTILVDPSRDNKYISTTSKVNYECINEGEYGDHIGHNEHDESKHFKTSKLEYHHFPLDLLVNYNKDVFKQYKGALLEIGRHGPVLFHCAIGKRAAFMGVLAAALQYEKDFQWALQRINELGFVVNEKSFPDVYDMYSAWLNPHHGGKVEF